jgi:hypothetical protein
MHPRLLLALPIVLGVAACGTKTVNTEKGERFIKKTVSQQVGATVKSVKCPDDIKAKKGGTFTCTVTGSDGTTGEAQVVQKDAKGNVRLSAPFVHVRNLERLMASDIGRQVNAKVTIECPEIITGKKGDTFDCKATDGKNDATVKVTQKDDRGNVRYKLVQQ